MPYRGSGRSGEVLSPTSYTEGQVAEVLRKCRIESDAETFNDFVCYCPFHGNSHTPAMSVSKSNGKYICFSGSCGATGSLPDLVKAMLKTNEFQTARIIQKAKTETTVTFEQELQKALAPVDLKEWEYAHTIPRMEEQLFNSPEALSYMKDVRGFDEETLRAYHVGYNVKRNLICVPVYSIKGVALGVVGRPCEAGKVKFKNSPGLPTSKTLYNIHNARRTGDVVVIVEASFDAMKVAMAGYPNVVSCLGGNFSEYHAEQLSMNFSTVVIMTDFDNPKDHRAANCRRCGTREKLDCKGHNPGRALGEKIADKMKGRNIKWAAFEPRVIFPRDAKDAGDMTLTEIRQCIQNAVPSYEYAQWGIPC